MWISGCRLELECDRDTSTKKDGRKKNGRKKQTILHQFFSSTTRQSTINQQSVRYLISQVKWIMQMWMILELEVRHPGDKEFMEKSFYLENLF